jgi:hypothetical protein
MLLNYHRILLQLSELRLALSFMKICAYMRFLYSLVLRLFFENSSFYLTKKSYLFEKNKIPSLQRNKCTAHKIFCVLCLAFSALINIS